MGSARHAAANLSLAPLEGPVQRSAVVYNALLDSMIWGGPGVGRATQRGQHRPAAAGSALLPCGTRSTVLRRTAWSSSCPIRDGSSAASRSRRFVTSTKCGRAWSASASAWPASGSAGGDRAAARDPVGWRSGPAASGSGSLPALQPGTARCHHAGRQERGTGASRGPGFPQDADAQREDHPPGSAGLPSLCKSTANSSS